MRQHMQHEATGGCGLAHNAQVGRRGLWPCLQCAGGQGGPYVGLLFFFFPRPPGC